MVQDATARFAPGPADDPAEAGHPGAREADVTGYIDAMLAAFDGNDPAEIFAGGPWSNRHTSGPDLMASFVALDPVTRIAWRQRLASWRQQYARGLATLDKLAGGDFTKARPRDQDKILAMLWGGEQLHVAAVRAHDRGPVLGPRVRRQPRPGGLEGHQLPGRHPAARATPPARSSVPTGAIRSPTAGSWPTC